MLIISKCENVKNDNNKCYKSQKTKITSILTFYLPQKNFVKNFIQKFNSLIELK